MYVRGQIDIGWSDLWAGMEACAQPLRRDVLRERVERRWSPDSEGFACLSVRTGFDLLLQALALPRGSEVLVSAITIPHMVQILEEHGLVAVPVDIDLETLGPDFEHMEAMITPRTRAVLVAHIFGARCDMEPIAALARRRELLLWEDCAQAFWADGYQGHTEADVTMFSFGSIKTATALGGAMFRVRDADVLAQMRVLEAAYPVQQRTFFAKRLLKYSALKGVGETPGAYDALVGGLRWMGREHESVIMGAMRGFSGGDFWSLVRKQPSAPLLLLLDRRLSQYPATRIRARKVDGESLRGYFSPRVVVPGRKAAQHTNWLFPVLVPHPEAVMRQMWREGYDAALGNTSLMCVDAPQERPEADPVKARYLMSHVLYLPWVSGMSQATLRHMAIVLENALVSSQTGSPAKLWKSRRSTTEVRF